MSRDALVAEARGKLGPTRKMRGTCPVAAAQVMFPWHPAASHLYCREYDRDDPIDMRARLTAGVVQLTVGRMCMESILLRIEK